MCQAHLAFRPATQSRNKIRVVSARAYHCLFMHNMLIRPTEAELATFGRPDFTIFNAGAFPCNRYTSYMTSSSSVDVNLKVLRACICSWAALDCLPNAAQQNYQRLPIKCYWHCSHAVDQEKF